VTFAGTVRATNLGQDVEYLEYSAHVPLAIKEMEAIRGEAIARWPLVDALLVHRVGHLQVGETAVVVGVSAPHRSEAFAACAWVIEELKRRVPIWKKEVTADGATWVGSTP
jgi:molybdopterin synthase catalytic subunit